MTIAIKQVTSDLVEDAIEYIALHNGNQRCMLLDDNAAGIRTDFANFEIEPIKDLFYVADNSDHGKISGLVGLITDGTTGFVIGPFASNESARLLLLNEIEKIAHLKDGLESLNSGMVGAVANSVFEQCGFVFLRHDLSMILNKEAKPIAASNADTTCVRLEPLDLEMHRHVQRIHAGLFKSRDFTPENWNAKFALGANHWVFVARLGSEVVGYSICQKQDSNVYLMYIGTDQIYQRKGIASSLLLFIRQWFIEAGYNELRLNVHTVKEHAVKLYTDVGFEIKEKSYGWEKKL